MRGKLAIILVLVIGLALGIAGFLQIKHYAKTQDAAVTPTEQISQPTTLAAQP